MPKCFQLLAVLLFRGLAIGMRVFVEERQTLRVKSLPFVTPQRQRPLLKLLIFKIFLSLFPFARIFKNSEVECKGVFRHGLLFHSP